MPDPRRGRILLSPPLSFCGTVSSGSFRRQGVADVDAHSGTSVLVSRDSRKRCRLGQVSHSPLRRDCSSRMSLTQPAGRQAARVAETHSEFSSVRDEAFATPICIRRSEHSHQRRTAFICIRTRPRCGGQPRSKIRTIEDPAPGDRGQPRARPVSRQHSGVGARSRSMNVYADRPKLYCLRL